MNIKRLSVLILASAAALLAGRASSQGRAEDLARIEHVVVIYAENRSFDHLYGLFPGADGIASATPEQKTQLDHDGNPLPHLPPVYDGGKPSPKFPQELPNGPFRIDAERSVRQLLGKLRAGLAAVVYRREVWQRVAVVVELSLLLRRRARNPVRTGKQPVEVIEAAVLCVDDDDMFDAREVFRSALRRGATGEERRRRRQNQHR